MYYRSNDQDLAMNTLRRDISISRAKSRKKGRQKRRRSKQKVIALQ